MYEIKELTEKNRADAEIVIKARFPLSALNVLDKVMSNPLCDEHKGFGEILYIDSKPVAFRAALRRRLFKGQREVLARVRGLTCRLVDSPKDSISKLVEAQKVNLRGCIMAISNTQCVPTEKRAILNGATLGPETCKRFVWRAIRPLKCIVHFVRRKILKMQPQKETAFNTLGALGFTIDIGELKIRRVEISGIDFFDRLMKRYLSTNVGFVSSRSAEEIEWIYGKGMRDGSVVALCAEDDVGPVGYLILKSDRACVRWLLGDMLVVNNQQDIMRVLLKSACCFLKRHTPAMMLESIGFSEFADSTIREFMPHERKCDANFDSFNFFCEKEECELNKLLLSDKSWFFGPYDGDMCLDE